MASYWSDDPSSDASDSEGILPQSERLGVELEKFRREWKGELAAVSKRSSPMSTSSSGVKVAERSLTPHEMAAKLYEKGMREERRGHMFEAIRYYRNAVHLVPDIEQKMAQSADWGQQKSKLNEDSDDASLRSDAEESVARAGLGLLRREWNRVVGAQTEETDTDDEKDTVEDEDGTHVWRVCVPAKEELLDGGRGHFSHCPSEVIALILRWVVSRDLDVRSLDIISGVSRGFYQACKDPELWKRICTRVWGPDCELPEQCGFDNWRDMYLQRPHPLFHGCYITKISYVRHGENSFQDQFYRPWYQVDYYRFLRFFPEGLCMMMTTPDEPHMSLHHLRTRNPRLGTVLLGQYRLHGDMVIATLKRVAELNTSAVAKQIGRARRNRSQEERSERTYFLELQVRNVRSRVNVELAWKRYSVLTYYPERQVGSTAEFELTMANFPPLRFSRVKSYTASSDFPLDGDVC